ncbi:dynamin-related protein drpb [Cystoisospora suis]|uniref:Dynamin-related protein drpb n=1 Tax=Cystoisospora suis TaxID=483139 RepID=A0A2C6JXP4_9APIC|nr:dynamin-related protein drpb [Cystoisospora suis]
MEERRALNSQLSTLKRASAVLQRDPTIAALNLDSVDETFDRDLRELQKDASSRPLPNLQAFSPAQQQQQMIMMNSSSHSSSSSSMTPSHTNALMTHGSSSSSSSSANNTTSSAAGGGVQSMMLGGAQAQLRGGSSGLLNGSAGGDGAGGVMTGGGGFASEKSGRDRGQAGGSMADGQKGSASTAAKHIFEKVKFQAANNPLFSD